MLNINRSEGLDPNGICYPCVMGWGLAGTGNSSAAAVVTAAVVAGGELKITKSGLFSWKSVKIVEKNVQIGEKSENRNLRWGIPDSADRSVLKS